MRISSSLGPKIETVKSRGPLNRESTVISKIKHGALLHNKTTGFGRKKGTRFKKKQILLGPHGKNSNNRGDQAKIYLKTVPFFCRIL
jgi:hypothetical protein